ncbi:MAG: hypothetical protein ACRC6F_02670 [Aeromonas sp.]
MNIARWMVMSWLWYGLSSSALAVELTHKSQAAKLRTPLHASPHSLQNSQQHSQQHSQQRASQHVQQPSQLQPQRAAPVWRSLDTNDLLSAPAPLSFGIEVSTDRLGHQRIRSYPQLNLSQEKRVSLSVDRFRPKLKFKTGGMQAAIRLRGDGVKLQFKPIDKRMPLQMELKLTDDESSLRLDYRF